jgi:hypothetical protein
MKKFKGMSRWFFFSYVRSRDIKINFRYTIKVNVNATAARTMKGERINEKQIDKKVGIEVDICTITLLCCRQGLNWKLATCSAFHREHNSRLQEIPYQPLIR